MQQTALTLKDFARLAQERMDPAVWDFLEGGAGEERTIAANLEAFDQVRLRPTVFGAATPPETTTTILGRQWAAPIAVAPMAFHTLAHPDGELATVRAAAMLGVPVVVSTFSGRTFEELAKAGSGPLWLQVYRFRDHAATEQLIKRAELAGFEALVLTVDTPHLGRRLRDLRNDFRLPPGIVPANFDAPGLSSPSEHARNELDPSLDWTVVDWLRSVSSLPVLVKGILTAEDARRAVDAGVDGILVSNHGGRQLDGVIATFDALPETVAAVAGRCPVLLDGGIRRGTDVLAALALGADAVLVGRPILHGLAVAQQEGVEQVLNILIEELSDAMALTGTPSLSDLRPDLIRLQPTAAQPITTPQPAEKPKAEKPKAERPKAERLRAEKGDLRKEDLHSSVADPVMDTMNFLNEITLRYPEAISFAPGRPYAGFFDTEQIFTYIRRYLDHLTTEGGSPEAIRDSLFQYGPTAGQIRELIAASLRADEGIEVAPESIVVTVGAQEAMFLALRVLISGPDDVLLVSSPCYVGITGAARLMDIELTAVEEREDGLSCADLEAAIRAELARGRRPRAVYVVPDHSNPSGVTMPLQTRRALLELAAEHDLLILEDSPYRLVSPGPQVPTLKSLDHDRRVVHLGSYSKTVFPGARVGFAVADQVVANEAGETSLLADEFAKVKSMLTVNTSALSQAAVAGALLTAGGRIAVLNDENAKYYGNSMQATLRELERNFPAELGVRWNRPSGGFFLAMQVPFRADNAALTRAAQDFGVIWTPMSYFYPQGGGDHTIRLSTSYLTEYDIQEGIARLARFVRSEL